MWRKQRFAQGRWEGKWGRLQGAQLESSSTVKHEEDVMAYRCNTRGWEAADEGFL